MKYLILLIFSLLLFACSNVKKVYWCGDHACINNKEKEAYFKKTMIVEIRELSKQNKKSDKINKIKYFIATPMFLLIDMQHSYFGLPDLRHL